MKPQTAMGRVGEPEEVASLVSFLVSKDASFITGKPKERDGCIVLTTHIGQNISVDGGIWIT